MTEMAPDDPGGVRELHFRFGRYHILVTASPDGDGAVRVMDDFYNEPPDDVRKDALATVMAMLSNARHWVFEAYLNAGGSVEELRELMELLTPPKKTG